jgi:2-polyprenyl-3-methyl-5-hydroxy-6-metoxy-1,4-benzoquinol methylase
LDRAASISYFLARSDVEAALKLLDGAMAMRPYIHKYWPQVFDNDEYSRVYTEAGEIETATQDVFDNLRYAWRLQMAVSWLNINKVQGVGLDFGCSLGYYAAHLQAMTAVKDWTCIDIDALSIEAARAQAKRNAQDSSRLYFVAGTEDDIPLSDYSVAVLFEVLEHVKDPRAVLQAVESHLKPDAWVIISLPSGPVEFTMWMDQPKRNREHIREYTLDDIYDVFGGKPEMRVQYISYGPNKYLSSMYDGCFFVVYRRSDQPIGEINWARKLRAEHEAVALPGMNL